MSHKGWSGAVNFYVVIKLVFIKLFCIAGEDETGINEGTEIGAEKGNVKRRKNIKKDRGIERRK